MKKYFLLTTLGLILFACASSEEKNVVKLNSFKDRISYALGADHARAITESGDPNFAKYDLEKMVIGFEQGLKDKKAFGKDCETTIKKLFGNSGRSFDTKYLQAGSECIGKISGVIFNSSWSKNKALDKIDLKLVVKGFTDCLHNGDTIIKRDEQSMMIQNFMFDIYKLNGEKMMENAAKMKGVKVLPSGVVIQTIKEGNGTSPAKGGDVLAHYILMNALGDTLQSSFDMVEIYKQPLTPFGLTNVIKGWQEGIPLMKKGGTYKLYVPYHLAYGEQGMFNPQSKKYDIQPFQSLVFYIELINHGPAGSLTK
jgi:FKBP-type peptidyl-prolyl cis-trans isomerase